MTLAKRCIDCEGLVESYRKSNLCEKCYVIFLEELEEERAEKKRTSWFMGKDDRFGEI